MTAYLRARILYGRRIRFMKTVARCYDAGLSLGHFVSSPASAGWSMRPLVTGGSMVMMEPSPPVIEYEPQRPLSPAAWLIRTPLRSDRVVPSLLILAWLVLCTGNAAAALRAQRQSIVYTAPIYTTLYAPVALATVCGCFWGLGRMRAWRVMAACAAACVVTGLVTGTVQVTSCPHASYLQVAGFYAPVWGDPCRNEQSDSLLPWWMH